MAAGERPSGYGSYLEVTGHMPGTRTCTESGRAGAFLLDGYAKPKADGLSQLEAIPGQNGSVLDATGHSALLPVPLVNCVAVSNKAGTQLAPPAKQHVPLQPGLRHQLRYRYRLTASLLHKLSLELQRISSCYFGPSLLCFTYQDGPTKNNGDHFASKAVECLHGAETTLSPQSLRVWKQTRLQSTIS